MATRHQQLDAMRALTKNWDGYDAARLLDNVIELGHEFGALIEAVLRDPSQSINVSPTRAGGVLPIRDDEILLRHIPGGTLWQAAGARITSANFQLRRDRNETGYP